MCHTKYEVSEIYTAFTALLFYNGQKTVSRRDQILKRLPFNLWYPTCQVSYPRFISISFQGIVVILQYPDGRPNISGLIF